MKKPSVSELTDLLNKPKLMHWANQLGLEGKSLNDVRRNNTKDGTNKHSGICNYINKGIKLSDANIQVKLESFLSTLEIVGLEETFTNDLFCGRVDVLFKKDSILYIGDFKRNYRKPYLEHYIQLVCYKMHFGAEKICIIDTNEFIIHEILLYDKENLYIELINHLVKIYHLKQIL